MNRHVNAICRPPEPAPAPAPVAGNSRPHHRDRPAQERRRHRRGARHDSVASFRRSRDFEREFPSLCFALATGVGKTRLMGAFISYLHLAHGINNFFVLAPESDDLQQADRRLHPEHAEVCLQGHRGICHRPAGDHHRRQLRGQGGHAV